MIFRKIAFTDKFPLAKIPLMCYNKRVIWVRKGFDGDSEV